VEELGTFGCPVMVSVELEEYVETVEDVLSLPIEPCSIKVLCEVLPSSPLVTVDPETVGADVETGPDPELVSVL